MQFVKESLINASAERVFAFHERPDALRLLTPPWEKTRIIESASISELGSRTIIETKVGPIKIRWVARHTKYEPPHLFEDIQIKGPFRSWRHRHKIESSDNGARLRDEITYEPPFRFLGKLFSPLFIERRLKRLFHLSSSGDS